MLFKVDKLSRTPIYEQIAENFIKQISSGELKAGDRLPSVRELSVALSINPNTIQKAYIELDRRQVIASAQGRGSFVTQDAVSILQKESLEKMDEFVSLARELKAAGAGREALLRAVDGIFDEKGEKNK